VLLTQETQSKTTAAMAGSHPGGNFMSGLGEFHHTEETETKSTKITHWIILAVVVVGMAAFALAWS
jgi:hypothetical protein